MKMWSTFPAEHAFLTSLMVPPLVTQRMKANGWWQSSAVMTRSYELLVIPRSRPKETASFLFRNHNVRTPKAEGIIPKTNLSNCQIAESMGWAWARDGEWGWWYGRESQFWCEPRWRRFAMTRGGKYISGQNWEDNVYSDMIWFLFSFSLRRGLRFFPVQLVVVVHSILLHVVLFRSSPFRVNVCCNRLFALPCISCHVRRRFAFRVFFISFQENKKLVLLGADRNVICPSVWSGSTYGRLGLKSIMIGRYFFQCSVSTIRCLHYMMILDRLWGLIYVGNEKKILL